jgi:hypothetical protein
MKKNKPKPKLLEKDLQKYAIEVMRLNNFYVFRTNNTMIQAGRLLKMPDREKGHPDCVALNKDGQIFFIEFKSPTGKQSEFQVMQQKEIEKRGGKYVLINSILGVTEFIAINK